MTTNSAIAAAVALSLAACSSYSYSPPGETTGYETEVTVDGAFDEVWSNIINHIRVSSLSLETIDKDSGLLIIRFGAGDPALFVECGTVGLPDGSTAPVAEWMGQNQRGRLSGLMNVLVQPVGTQRTTVRANAQYELRSEGLDRRPYVWTFETNGQDEVGGILCLPNHMAEKTAIDGAMRTERG